MNQMIKPIVVLLAICIISSALLGMTYNATAQKIIDVNQKASDAAAMEVLPGASTFAGFGTDALDTEVYQSVLEETSGKGYVFKVKDKGFGGAYSVMVGIDADGKVTGAKLMENTETPGLGSKTGTPDFTGRFVGKTGAEIEGVETITGATISSDAFKRCVALACEAYEGIITKGASMSK